MDKPFDSSAPMPEEMSLLNLVVRKIAQCLAARRATVIEREERADANRRWCWKLRHRLRSVNSIGNSKAMPDLYGQIQQVADSDTAVLILGERGRAGSRPRAITYATARSEERS